MKHLGDITNINGAEIEPVDIITFGSPCQDLSVAGKREGLVDGKRSNLFYQAVRIIREMREATNGNYPTFAIWENVPGAFSSNGGQDFRSVLEEITESEVPMPQSGKWATAGMVRGNGRSAAWRILDAQYFGVPQRRKRIFLVADFAGQRAGEILFECESVPGDIAESRKAREEVAADFATSIRTTVACEEIAGTLDSHYYKGPGMRTGTERTFVAQAREEVACGAGDGADGAIAFGGYNQTIGKVSQTIRADKTDGDHVGMVLQPIAGTVSAKWAKGTGGPAGDECQNLVAFGPGGQGDIAHAIRSQPSKADKPSSTTATRSGPMCLQAPVTTSWSPKMWREGNDVTNPLLATDYKDPQIVIAGILGGQHPNAFGEYADDDTASAMKARDYKDATDLVAIAIENHPADSRVKITEDGKVQTLTGRMGTGGGQRAYGGDSATIFHPFAIWTVPRGAGTLRANGGDLGGGSENLVSNNYTVRRLTVVECLRLQGFPDWWLDGVPGYSDTQGYKTTGNSVAIPCVDWIMGRMALAKLSKEASQWTGSTAIKKRTNA